MNYEDFVSDLPTHRTIEFKSAEENEEVLLRYGVDQQTRQLGKGPFRSGLAVRTTEQADLFVDRYNTAVSLRLVPPTGTVALLFPRSANGRFLCCGEEVGNSALIVFASGSELNITTSGLAGSEAIAIPEARFIEMIEVLCPTLKSVWPDLNAVIQGDTAQLHALRKAVLKLVNYTELDPNPEHLSNEIAATIAWMGYSLNNEKPERITDSRARTHVAKLAQTFIEEHYRNAVCNEDLCRVTGTSARTLQRCFREYFDLTITDYLKMVRLDATHRELVSAHPSKDTVARIAIDNGFTHLGRFSIAFRERFAESPRKTLAMQLGNKS